MSNITPLIRRSAQGARFAILMMKNQCLAGRECLISAMLDAGKTIVEWLSWPSTDTTGS
jgi:hypothetical protein